MTTSSEDATPPEHSTSSGDATPLDQPPSRRFTIVFTAAMVVIAIGWAWVWHARTDRLVVGPPPIIAVAGIVIDTAAGTLTDSLAGTVGDMLAVGIRRTGVPVIETAQLYAITGGSAHGAGLVDAARQLGATQVVQGALRVLDTGEYELETRRVDAQTRDLVMLLRTRGTNIIDVVDRMAAHFALGLGLRVPDGSVADAMTRSLDAYVAYESGMRALYAGDTTAATVRLNDALRLDPSFLAASELHTGITTHEH